jgi:hypothetical protein
MKKFTLFITIFISMAAFAQDLPDPESAGDEPSSAEAISPAENELSEAASVSQEPSLVEAISQVEDEPSEVEIEALPAILEPPPAPAEPIRRAEVRPVELTPMPEPEERAASGLGKPAVAIYMAGEEPEGVRGVHSILGGELARIISESEKYTAVDRTEAVRKQLANEHIFQRSGAVSDEQIKSLGRQLGAQYMCISNLNAVGKRSYYLDVRLVDIETAEIIRTATATSSLKDANAMTRAARNIAFELIETEKAKAQRNQKKKIFLYTAVGLDVLGAGAIVYGIVENNNVKKLVEDGDYPDADRAVERRNIAYIAGAAFLASGITIHILF